MILSQCTIVFCRISSFNILIPNSLLDFILYYILELINISTHVALLTMNYMVRTLLFSLQYIRYLYVNVFIYACFWYLLLLKYIVLAKLAVWILAKVEMSMVTSMPNISKTAGGSLQQIFSLDICLDFFAKITKIEPWEF